MNACTPRRALSLAAAAAILLSLVACADPVPTPADSGTESGHGDIAGAAEVAEPPLALVSVSMAGEVAMLDLVDGESATLGQTASPLALATDGRYAFVSTDAGIEVVDSGRWTWDHVDHFHYYRAEPRVIGAVTGEGPAHVTTGLLSTAGSTGLFFAGSGEAVLIDNAALSDGAVVERFRIAVEGGPTVVAPFGDGAIIGVGDELAVYSGGGARTDAAAPCVSPAGAITTRVGVAVGCADGAVLVTGDASAPTFERIPYPADATPGKATSFDARKGRPTVAALAGAAGFWLLDTRERAWAHVATSVPLMRVVAVDDAGGHVVGLDEAGRLRVYAAASGTELAVTGPLVSEIGPAVSLTVDDQRAYVNDPVAGVVHEVAFADGARVARTLTPPVAGGFVAEVGR